MWSMIFFFLGTVQLRVTGASPEQCLRRLADQRIAFRFLGKPDAFSAEIEVLRRDVPRAERQLLRGGCECETEQARGAPAIFGGLLQRPVLLILLALAVAAAIVVPKFVFFYSVSGNETVPDAQILRELRELGVGFGTYGPSIRPQELKNQMLLRIPKLQWLTVQQSGMCARVVVRERPEKEPILDRRTPANVIAARSGVITRVSAEAGFCLCSPGQAVKSGELLVSAYTDFGYKTQVTAARAEIYAQTVRMADCILPAAQQVKDTRAETRSTVSLWVGRRRIRLFGRGADGSFCEKQTERRTLTLPGGFSLPLGIEITRICEYDTRDEILQAEDVRQRLLAFVQTQAQREMIAGMILASREHMTEENGGYCLHAALQCEEMIARMQPANLKEAIQ